MYNQIITLVLLFLSFCTRKVDLFLVASNNNKINEYLKEVSPLSTFTFDFADNSVRWQICNIHSGTFSWNRFTKEIVFNEIASTEMSCFGKVGELDDLVMQYFRAPDSYYYIAYDGNVHYLVGKNGWLIFVNSKIFD